MVQQEGWQRNLFCLVLMKRICCRPYARRLLLFSPSKRSLRLGALWYLRGPQEWSRLPHTCHLTGPGSCTNSDGAMSTKESPHWDCECWDQAADGNDLGPVSLSTSDLFNWKNNIPTYWDKAKKKEEFFFHQFFFFLNSKSDLDRCQYWIQNSINTLLISEDRRMVLDKAHEAVL